MKKIIASIITVAMALTLFAGCSKAKKDDTTIRVGSLKGPTTIGLVNLMDEADKGTASCNYEFTMATDASEIAAGLNAGNIDIALIPANLAAKLYATTDGSVVVIDINTLGVLYCVTGDSSITSPADLNGKTILTTGQGTTPEYALRYVLDSNNVTDYELDFKSEATEIAALLAEDPNQIAVLPQPFVTVACMNNEALSVSFSLSDEWDKVSSDSSMVTGVTVVRKEFLEEHEGLVKSFLEEHKASTEKALTDVESTADLVVAQEIIAKAPIAIKAIPNCNIVCITGEEMKTALNGYLTVLYNQDPTSVGGAVPSDDFYYIAK